MIDWDRVNTLRDEIGAEDFAEVVPMFLEEADEIIAELSGSVDTSSLEGQFHALKGSAMNLGLAEFAKISATQEKLAAEGAFEQIDIASAINSYSASKAEFLAKIGSDITA